MRVKYEHNLSFYEVIDCMINEIILLRTDYTILQQLK
jgi:hypothetical protein